MKPKIPRTTLTLLKLRTIVDGNGCWIWQGAVSDKGYGSLTLNGKRKQVHRHAKELRIGRKLLRTEILRHTCDMPACINPKHLLIGTHLDNVHDCIKKGRFKNPPLHKGEEQHSAKLTEQDVKYIRRTHRKIHSVNFLAKKFNVSRKSITNAAVRRTWAWL